jgi:restriction endonuclease S subunit
LTKGKESTLDAFIEKQTIDNETCKGAIKDLGKSEKWKQVKLENLVIIESGKRPRGGSTDEGVPSLGGEQLSPDGKVYWNKLRYIPGAFFNSLRKGKVKLNDVLMVKDGATTGKVAFVSELPFNKVAVNEHVFIIRSLNKKLLLNKYLFYVLFSEIGQSQIRKLFHGATQGGITQENIKCIKIPLPPLEEQERIVARIEEILSRVEQAKRLREEALKQTEQIMQSALHEVFSKAEEKWEWIRLGDKKLCQIIPGQHILSQNYGNEPKGTPYITGPADFSFKYPIITKWTLDPKVFAHSGDVLLTVKGAGAGKVNCAPNHDVAIGRQIMALRPNPVFLHQEFLYFYLMYKFNYFQEIARSATVPGIRKDQLQAFIVPLLPIKEQKRIVTYLNSLQEKVLLLRKHQEETRKEIEAITQTVLKKAFSGRL